MHYRYENILKIDSHHRRRGHSAQLTRIPPIKTSALLNLLHAHRQSIVLFFSTHDLAKAYAVHLRRGISYGQSVSADCTVPHTSVLWVVWRRQRQRCVKLRRTFTVRIATGCAHSHTAFGHALASRVSLFDGFIFFVGDGDEGLFL